METVVGLSVTDVLIGQEPRKNLFINLKMTAWPAGDRLKDIYVLTRLNAQGEREAIGWTYMVQGICVDDATARTLHIHDELDKLYESGRLACPGRAVPKKYRQSLKSDEPGDSR